MAYSLATAAQVAGVSKPTVFRWIRSGKISASRTDTNEYRIDPSELDRYLQSAKETPAPIAETRSDTAPTFDGMDAKALQDAVASRVAQLEELLRIERERIAELREDREHWREQAQRLALTHEKAAIVVPPAPSAPEVLPGLLARLAAAVRG